MNNSRVFDIKIDDINPAIKPTSRAILKFSVSLDPNIIRHTTGIIVVIVVRIDLNSVSLIESFIIS